MALITGEARYSDLLEWQLYNAAAVGMGLNGDSYLYNNPLACRGGITRQAWYDVPCCPSNLSRTWADLGRYVYSRENDELWIHQYVGSRVTLEPNVPVEVELHPSCPSVGASLSGSIPRPARSSPCTCACLPGAVRPGSWSTGPRLRCLRPPRSHNLPQAATTRAQAASCPSAAPGPRAIRSKSRSICRWNCAAPIQRSEAIAARSH